MFKGLTGLGSLLKQAQEIGGRMKGLDEELRRERVVGAAGGGMVELEVNGLMEVLGCRIDPSLVGQGDRELLEDLVRAAVNEAIRKAKEVHAEKIRSMTGGLALPGIEETLSKFLAANEQDPPDAPPEPRDPEPPRPPTVVF
jgi:DNA-binding YbaB/EbfC family protein